VEREVFVDRIFELPQRVVVKEVPIEVIVERIVELPPRVIIK
jgi:hypothetical protein